MTFAGFPSRPQSTAIANVFFSDLLPQLTDPVALGVVLYALQVLSAKKGFPRFITSGDIAAEPAAVRYLAAVGGADAGAAIGAGLARAVELGILLSLTVVSESGRQELLENIINDNWDHYYHTIKGQMAGSE